MDLATRKYNFIKELTSVDEVLLEKLEKVLFSDKNNKVWFLNLSNAEQTEIKTGLQEAERKEFVSHEEVMKKFEKWH